MEEETKELAKPGQQDLTEDQVKMWWRRIRREQARMHDRYRKWDERIDLYMASEGIKRPGRSVEEIKVNLIPSTLQIVINNLWTRNRQIFGKSDDSDVERDVLPALQNRLRRLWRKLRPHRQVRRAILDALLMGRGFLKIGYDVEHFGSDRQDRDGRDIETNTGIVEGLPWIQRLSPKHIYVDPDATDLDDARWIVTLCRRPLAEVKGNPAYRNTGDLQDGELDYEKLMRADYDDPKLAEDVLRGGKEDRGVVLYEVQDKTTRTTFVLAEGLKDKTLVPPVRDAMPFRGFNVESFCFDEVPDEFFGLSEIGQWEDHQRNLSELRSRMLDYAKRWAWIWLARKGVLSMEDKNALISAESQTIVEVDDPNAIQPMPAAAMPAEFGTMEQIIQNDIRQISSVADFQRGGSIVPRTATEASIMQTAQQGRGQPMRDEVTDMMDRVLSKVGTIFTALMLQPGDEPIEEGVIEWQFDAPSAQAFSPEVRRKLWTDTVNLSLAVSQAMPGRLNMEEVLRRWFEAHDIQDIDELIPPQTSPGSGLTPDQENLRLVAGLPVSPSEDEDFATHIKAHSELMEMPEVQDGKIDSSQIVAHIQATMSFARAMGVMLPDVGAPGAPGAPGDQGGPIDGDMLRSGPVTEQSVM